MIFLTVGTQLPFDRLVRLVDFWASKNPDAKLFGQIGPCSYSPKFFNSSDFMTPAQVDDLFSRASLIVSHAGMGSILSALKWHKPIVIFPRVAALGEHRNEHQLATANNLRDVPGVYVASSDEQLFALLDGNGSNLSGGTVSEFAQEALIDNIRAFLRS